MWNIVNTNKGSDCFPSLTAVKDVISLKFSRSLARNSRAVQCLAHARTHREMHCRMHVWKKIIKSLCWLNIYSEAPLYTTSCFCWKMVLTSFFNLTCTGVTNETIKLLFTHFGPSVQAKQQHPGALEMQIQYLLRAAVIACKYPHPDNVYWWPTQYSWSIYKVLQRAAATSQ